MDYAEIFQSQKDFFRTHATKDVGFRKAQLQKIKSLISDNENKMYEAIQQDFGKSKFETFLTELSLVYNEIDFFTKNLDKLCKPKKIKTPITLQPATSHIYYDALGVTLVIGAWNYPYQLTLLPLISSLAAGNTCILKPSELPGNTMHLLADLINNNFPSDYLYVAEGGADETTELLKLPYDKIFFTGSPKVGKIVYEAAAKNLVPVVLELGGKSPTIVSQSANLEVAAKRIVWGKFLNAGQTCIAPDYLLVEESVKLPLIDLIKKKLQETNYFDGADYYTKIINKKNFDRVNALIDKNKIIYGGKTNQNTLYIEPTVLNNINFDDAVMKEEIFGPVLPILTFSNFDATLDKILEGEKPLSAYLFTNNNEEKTKFLQQLSFGGGCINDTLMHIANDDLPFGGIGNSGIGNYHGEFGFLTFSHQKAVVDKATWLEPKLKYPPYSDTKMKWLKKLM